MQNFGYGQHIRPSSLSHSSEVVSGTISVFGVKFNAYRARGAEVLIKYEPPRGFYRYSIHARGANYYIIITLYDIVGSLLMYK